MRMILAFLLLAFPALAQVEPGAPPRAMTPLGYQQLTSLSSAATLTVPTGATYAVITCESQTVRWRDDGTSPTSSVGQQLLQGQTLSYPGPLSTLAFIETTASAKLNVSYYK